MKWYKLLLTLALLLIIPAAAAQYIPASPDAVNLQLNPVYVPNDPLNVDLEFGATIGAVPYFNESLAQINVSYTHNFTGLVNCTDAEDGGDVTYSVNSTELISIDSAVGTMTNASINRTLVGVHNITGIDVNGEKPPRS